MLGLRTSHGIDLNKIKKEFDVDLLFTKEKEIKYLQDNGFIDIKDGFLFATDLGFTVLNRVILELV